MQSNRDNFGNQLPRVIQNYASLAEVLLHCYAKGIPFESELPEVKKSL